MLRLPKLLATGAIAALVGAGTIVASTAPASAYVVCNRWGQCWHTYRHYYYPAYYGDPYYNGYDYGPSYGPGYGYYGGGPTIGLGFSFGGDRGWHGGEHEQGGWHHH